MDSPLPVRSHSTLDLEVPESDKDWLLPMAILTQSFGRPGQSERCWLCGILLGFIALFLSLMWKHTGAADPLLVDLFFYAGVFRLLWVKRERLVIEAGRASTLFGLALILFVLVRSLSAFWFETVFLKLAPLLAFFGVALLASGFKGLPQFWREMLILGVMVFPTAHLWPFLQRISHFDTVTAVLSGFLLHYLDYDVVQRGVTVVLPTGAVEIGLRCTGLPMTLLLLKFALLFVIVMPLRPWQRLGVPLAAVALGVVLGCVRVAVMAVSVSDRARFDFWHGDAGAQIFSTLAIVLLYLLCRWVARGQRMEAASNVA